MVRYSSCIVEHTRTAVGYHLRIIIPQVEREDVLLSVSIVEFLGYLIFGWLCLFWLKTENNLENLEFLALAPTKLKKGLFARAPPPSAGGISRTSILFPHIIINTSR